jgi:hypothetical protein
MILAISRVGWAARAHHVRRYGFLGGQRLPTLRNFQPFCWSKLAHRSLLRSHALHSFVTDVSHDARILVRKIGETKNERFENCLHRL